VPEFDGFGRRPAVENRAASGQSGEETQRDHTPM
jgi:hypothetical protein